MSLNRGTVNALSVLGLRKLSFIPEHFTKLSIEHRFDVKAIEHWIEYNLDGRYAVKDGYGLDQERKLVTFTEIGMEDPKELTMLAIGCQHLYIK